MSIYSDVSLDHFSSRLVSFLDLLYQQQDCQCSPLVGIVSCNGSASRPSSSGYIVVIVIICKYAQIIKPTKTLIINTHQIVLSKILPFLLSQNLTKCTYNIISKTKAFFNCSQITHSSVSHSNINLYIVPTRQNSQCFVASLLRAFVVH